jgi:hypothetical protein
LPFLNELDGEIVGQSIAAAWVGGLDVELLKNLHGESNVSVGQNLSRNGLFSGEELAVRSRRSIKCWYRWGGDARQSKLAVKTIVNHC